MVGGYDSLLIVLSIAVAIIASYVALDLASRVAASLGSKAARYWLIGGAISMGTGIWSMHFIGMLAFRLPIPMSYHIPTTLLSLLIAVLVSGFALYTVSHGTLSIPRLLGAGLLMGMGIAAMHYTGMAAMQMQPPIGYDPFSLCPFHPDRHRRFADCVVDRLSTAFGERRVRILEEGRQRAGDGWRHRRHALHGHGGCQLRL